MSIRVICPRCGHDGKAPDWAAGQVAPCPKCGGNMRIPGTPVMAEAIDDEPGNRTGFLARLLSSPTVRCQHCGGTMRASYASRGGSGGVAVVGLLICLVSLFIFWPLIIVGIPLVILGMLMGNNKSVWKCRQCGSIHDRG